MAKKFDHGYRNNNFMGEALTGQSGGGRLPAMTAKPPSRPNSPMERALNQARKAAESGEVPVGAVLVDSVSGEILAEAHNRVEETADPTAHAEMLVIREAAGRLGLKRLTGADLYVTLEPCPMCAAAIAFARLRRLYFGAYDSKGGGVDHGARIFEQPTCHHRPEIIGGVEERASTALLQDFFKARR